NACGKEVRIIGDDRPSKDDDQVGAQRIEHCQIALGDIDIVDVVASLPQRSREAAQILEADMADGLHDAPRHVFAAGPAPTRAVRICSKSFSAAAAVASGSIPEPMAIVSPIASVVMRIALFFPDTRASGSDCG